MEEYDAPDLCLCLVCKRPFYSEAYQGDSDICSECFESQLPPDHTQAHQQRR